MNEITTRILKILLLVFAVVMASTIFYHLLFQDYETENATYYEVTDFSAFQGVYVRGETVQRYHGTGAVRYCVEDGAKLGVGSVIAEVYSGEEQIDLRRRIADKEAELAMLRQIENPGTSENAQPAKLSALIAEQYKSLIRLRERGRLSEMAQGTQNLNVLMGTYEKITNPSIDYNSRIVALEDEIERLNAQLDTPDQIIRANKSAYFISYVDGYEDKLRPEQIRQLTPEQLAEVKDDPLPLEQAGLGEPIGKLVDSYEWYIAGVFDNTKMRLSDDDYVTVRLESVPESLKVQVVSLISSGDVKKTQAIFRCEQMTHDVVQHRTERVEILRDTVEGIRVPRSAIRFKALDVEHKDEQGNVTVTQEDCIGVYVLVGEAPEFRRLDVVYEDEDYYLSALDAGSGFVALYDDLIVKGVMADGT